MTCSKGPAKTLSSARAMAQRSGAACVAASMTDAGILSRRELLRTLALLALPAVHPRGAAAAAAQNKVWGVDVPLKQDILQELKDEGGGVRAAEMSAG